MYMEHYKQCIKTGGVGGLETQAEAATAGLQSHIRESEFYPEGNRKS